MNRLGILLAAAMGENSKKNHWFIDFSGHVEQIKLKYYPNGWAPGSKTMTELQVYLNSANSIKTACLFLEQNLKKVPKQ